MKYRGPSSLHSLAYIKSAIIATVNPEIFNGNNFHGQLNPQKLNTQKNLHYEI